MAPAQSHVRNRIVASGIEDPSQLLYNPANWRIHPLHQQEALTGVLEEVGWVQEVIVNRVTGHLIDGHLRVQLADKLGEQTIPVKYVDLTVEEEEKVLATFDAIGGLAVPDRAKVEELTARVQTDSEAVQALLDEMRASSHAALEAMERHRQEEDRGLDDAPAEDDELLSSGESLARLHDITIAEPRHTVSRHDVYLLSRQHVLVVARVFDEWPLYVPYLDKDALLAPYAGPFVALTDKADAQDRRIVLVQPDPYIAGHILDRYAAIHGDAAIQRATA